MAECGTAKPGIGLDGAPLVIVAVPHPAATSPAAKAFAGHVVRIAATRSQLRFPTGQAVAKKAGGSRIRMASLRP